MKIYLIRHGQSAGNVDKDIHNTMADHAIPLSALGKAQAFRAGQFFGELFHKNYGTDEDVAQKIGTMLKLDDLDAAKIIAEHAASIRVWLSPYQRTRQTADGIFQGLNDYQQQVGESINVYMDRRENIRLCEQQFGLFDGIPDEELPIRYPDEHAHYKKCEDQEGRFWARMPLGESRFDVANRVHESFGTFHRDSERHGINTIIVVCHGVTLRAFVMQWLHLTPEWFDAEPNPGNCDIRLIDGGKDEGYIYRGK